MNLKELQMAKDIKLNLQLTNDLLYILSMYSKIEKTLGRKLVNQKDIFIILSDDLINCFQR